MARRVLGAIAATAAATLASLALATPASAHTPVVDAKCDPKLGKSILTVDLQYYGSENKNTLEVTIDGEKQDKITFGRELRNQKWERDGKVVHKYKVSIKAYDDPNGDRTWTRVFDNIETAACVEAPPVTTTKPSTPKPPVTTSPSAEVPSSSAPSSSTPAAPAPGGSTPEPPLAATGASPLWLLLSGLGLVGAGAAAVLFVRRRRA